MKPLNSQERTKQFFIFLAFFLVTVFLIVSVVYFNLIYNPKKHKEIIETENINSRITADSYEKFRPAVDSLFNDLQTAEKLSPSQMIQALDDASKKRSDLKSELESDGLKDNVLSAYPKLFGSNISQLSEIQKLKESIVELNSKLEDTKEELKTTKEDYKNYQILHPN